MNSSGPGSPARRRRSSGSSRISDSASRMPALARVVAPLVGVIVAIALFIATRGLDDVARAEQLGPGFWPRLVLIGLGLACVAKLGENLRRGVPRGRAAAPADRAAPLSGVRRGTLGLAIATLTLYRGLGIF